MLIVGHSRTAHPGTWAWPAGLIVWGPGNHTSSHAHHSIQVVMALSGRLKTRGSSAERWGSAGAVIVPPDVTHEIDARGRTILIAFIDPESALGRAMTARAARAMTKVADSDVQRWRRLLGPSSSIREAALRKWLEQELGSGTEPGVMDPRVATVIRVLAVTAASHFTSAKRELIAMVPPALPRPELLVASTGVAEAAGAALLLVPATRPLAAYGLIFLFAVMLPANISAARRHLTLRGRPATALWLRLPMQLLFIVWAWAVR